MHLIQRLRRVALRHVSARAIAALGTCATAAVIAILVGRSLADAPGDPGVRVAHSSSGPPRLVDRRGRDLFLRGVAVTSLIQYGNGYHENPPAGNADFAEMAALGFDFVRLPVSWSGIAPRPGAIDKRYLARVVSLVHAARRHGLRVLVDMHVDRYNPRLNPGNEADGAPDWATLVPGWCWAHPQGDVCTRAAWESFWENRRVRGRGLQQFYIGALRALSRRLRGQPGLAGIELMNNPSSGGVPSPAFETRQMWPFYRRAIAALRADGEQRPLWIDRAASAEITDTLARGRPGGAASDRGLVLAPHDYAGVFSKPTWPAGGISRLAQWYRSAVGQARSLRAALVIGEWGSSAGGAWDGLTAAELRLQDAWGLGSAFWMWKQRPGFYNWYLVNQDGSLRQDSVRAQLLSQPHPDAVPGRLVGCAFGGGRLTVRVTGAGGTATLWSGTQVRSGGPSLLPAPLTHAAIDGRPAPVGLSRRVFRSARVSLLGYVVSVRVPRGTHTLTLS